MSLDCCVALPHSAMGLSAVCDCGISWSYSLTIFDKYGRAKGISNNMPPQYVSPQFAFLTSNLWIPAHVLIIRIVFENRKWKVFRILKHLPQEGIKKYHYCVTLLISVSYQYLLVLRSLLLKLLINLLLTHYHDSDSSIMHDISHGQLMPFL